MVRLLFMSLVLASSFYNILQSVTHLPNLIQITLMPICDTLVEKTEEGTSTA